MLDSYVPHGFTRTRTDVPWLTRELKRKCVRKRRMYNKAKRSKQTIHWDIYKEYAKALKKGLRQAHWQHINTILLAAEEDSNPKPFWNYIRSQNQDNIGLAPLTSKGRLHTDANDRAKILSDQFKSVFTRDLDPASKDTAPSGPSYPQMPSFNITEAGVRKLLLNINPSKAGGRTEFLPYAEGHGGRDHPCVDLHIHTKPYHRPGPIWVEETMDYADLQERPQVRSL